MNRPTDETLMAYADDALDEGERAMIEQYLATDADARDLVAAFRRSRDLAARAFDEALTSPPPKHLVDLIMSHPATPGSATPISAADNVVVLAPRPRASPMATWALPMAASLAFAIGLGTGWLYRPTQPVDVALGPLPARSELSQVLEGARTGIRRNRHLVVATFRDKLDRPCRELELFPTTTADAPLLAGIACREPNGTWIVEGAARLRTAKANGNGAYVPSGAVEADALGSLLEMMGAKPALSADEERALIERGWK